jgi:hypothetical protein
MSTFSECEARAGGVGSAQVSNGAEGCDRPVMELEPFSYTRVSLLRAPPGDTLDP